jgi:hypothetical protein
LLSLGSLYLISDSLEKNLKKAEDEVGDKSQEAIMALHGSRMAILGGGIEAVGLVVKGGATRIVNSSYLRTSGVSGASKAIGIGMSLARSGAIIGAVAGIYDAVQTGIAIRRSDAAGDGNAARDYTIAQASYTLGTVFSLSAIFYPVLLGPLGLAIVFGMTGYAFLKLGEKNESTPLEKWARRCYFGKANETPTVHWDMPEHADLAFAELNAVTLGLTTAIGFKRASTDPIVASKVGRMEFLEATQYVKFRIILPDFHEEKSGYYWALIFHRHSDDQSQAYSRGEIVSSGQLHRPFFPAASLMPAALPAPPKAPDYNKESIFITSDKHRVDKVNKMVSFYMEIVGVIELLPDKGRHSIQSAELLVSYWPDRDTKSAYAELVSQAQNK